MNKKVTQYFIVTLILSLAILNSCTKEVELEFPEAESKIVVDGTIEPGTPPFIFLGRSNSFNIGLDPTSLGSLFLNGANVTINDGTNDFLLDELCVNQLSGIQLNMLSESLGISVQELVSIDYCIYTSFDLLGEVGKSYDLRIEYENEVLESSTSILPAVPLDSLWFETNASDSLGLLHAILSDPPDTSNAFRWFAQRISTRPGTNEMEDATFIAPLGSAFDDTFFQGLSFELFAARGSDINSQNEEDSNIEAGLFKVGDTVVVKLCAITPESYSFYFTLEDQILNNGSPFATPGNVPSNISGGLGIWTGYSPFIDTLICQ